MDLTYRREGRLTFPEMVEAVERSVRSNGFDVVRRRDLQAALAAKGFHIQPFTVLEVAIPGAPVDVCKMHVYADDGVVWVSAVRAVCVWGEAEGMTEGQVADIDASVALLIDAACSL